MMSVLKSPLRIFVAAAAIAIASWFAIAAPAAPSASAHPLGNFTINHYSRIELYSDAILVRYVIDLAEVPTFREIGDIDTNGDGDLSDQESAAYLESRAPELGEGLSLSLDDRPTELQLLTSDISYPEGQAGLDTLRIALWLRAEATPATISIGYRDSNYTDRIGWREIVVMPAAGAALTNSTASTTDLSKELTSYPGDVLTSPPDVSSVTFEIDVTDAAPAPSLGDLAITGESLPVVAPARSGSAFASLIDVDNLTVPAIVAMLLAAMAFGAIHALEPGHGKTLVAAYFVGIKGTAHQAIGLGLIIATTHTLGVLTIGAITIFGSQYVLPEDLYPWLSLAAGIMVLALGVRLVLSRVSGLGILHRLAHCFSHSHHHVHNDPIGDGETGGAPWRSLVAIGLADGLVPSPSTLVVLLAAISLDRVGLGLAIVVAFSVGLAAVLTAVSLALVYTRRVADWFSSKATAHQVQEGLLGRFAGLATNQQIMATYLPIAGAVALVAVGATLTVRALPAAGLTILF